MGHLKLIRTYECVFAIFGEREIYWTIKYRALSGKLLIYCIHIYILKNIFPDGLRSLSLRD